MEQPNIPKENTAGFKEYKERRGRTWGSHTPKLVKVKNIAIRRSAKLSLFTENTAL